MLVCRSEILSVAPHEKGGHVEHEHGDHSAAKHFEVEKCAALGPLGSVCQPQACPLTSACLLRPALMGIGLLATPQS